jgi:hypothetical protein
MSLLFLMCMSWWAQTLDRILDGMGIFSNDIINLLILTWIKGKLIL